MTTTSKSSPIVSVVVPTYNRARCVTDAIDSILAQTYPNVDVVVVDDGSTDDTREVIARRYSAGGRVRYVYQENGGVCAARNRGFAEATGDYIGLLDSDDVWLPWKVELQVACFRRRPDLGMVWTDITAVDDSGAVLHPKFLRTMYTAYRWFSEEELFSARYPVAEVAANLAPVLGNVTLYTGEIYSQMVMGSLVHTSSVLLSRRRLEVVKSFDESLAPSGEDYDFHLRTCREGPVGFVDVSSILYKIGSPDQLSRQAFYVARNFLLTVERAVARDRDRIKLPAWMIETVLAEGAQWTGSVLLAQGRNAEARDYLWRSLRHRFDRATLRMIAISLVPLPLRGALRNAYRKAAGALGRTAKPTLNNIILNSERGSVAPDARGGRR